MPDVKKFVEAMVKNAVPNHVINDIITVVYQADKNKEQENANYYAKAIPKCEELIGFDKMAEVMFDKACCKSGYRLSNAKQMNKEYGTKPIPEKLAILASLKYMGHPYLNEDGDIVTDAVGSHYSTNMTCPCWMLKGHKPADGKMPLTYCLCCAGHFMFHYQKALNLELRVKKVVSSILNSEGKEPCVFIYEIVK